MQFQKIRFEEYKNACEEVFGPQDEEALRKEYDAIQLPKRSTYYSAAYDFFIPRDSNIFSSKAVLIPTGIRWVADDMDYVLLCVPRSGLGFRYGLRLVNTIGVIDSDYCKADNEGHIMFKMVCDSTFKLKAGERFVQGIITNFLVTDDDETDAQRTGGFGSTGK